VLGFVSPVVSPGSIKLCRLLITWDDCTQSTHVKLTDTQRSHLAELLHDRSQWFKEKVWAGIAAEERPDESLLEKGENVRYMRFKTNHTPRHFRYRLQITSEAALP
jgi:hypothetical protein